MENTILINDITVLLYSFIYAVFLGFGAGCLGYVFINVLIMPDAILGFWTEFIQTKVLKMGKYCPPKNWQLALNKAWTNCSKCFSGQLSIIAYIVSVFVYHVSVLGIFFALSIAILTAINLEKNK